MARSRRWGWHAFEPPWAELLVAEAGITPGTLVVDVGAGTGELIGPLLEAGARVIAVEAHPHRATVLRQRFGRSVIVVQADAANLRLPRRPYRVVANPPFAITTPLLRRLLQPGSRLVGADLVLQEQAARRWAGPDAPAWRRWARYYQASLGRPVPPHAFRPAPAVAARVLHIRQRT